MITPLTTSQTISLERLKGNLAKLGDYESWTVIINNENKEEWLSIITLALRANELVTEQWRKGPKSVVEL